MSEKTLKKFRLSWDSPIVLILGIVLGSFIGIFFKEKAIILKPLGDIFLNMMFMIVVPMVFCSIASAVGNMSNMKRLGKILGSTITVFLITGIIAAIYVIITVNIFPPAAGTKIAFEQTEALKSSAPGELLVNTLTVSDFPALLSRKNMLPLIIFGIVFGYTVALTGGEESPVARFLDQMNEIMMKIVNFIMLYAPIGLGAYFAALIGEFGPTLIGDYGRTLAIYYPLCALYFFTAFPAYSFFAGGKEGVQKMFSNILPPAITAFATQSSVATIPVNKKACKEIGVPEDVSDIVLPMGATMHMDGSVLSSIVKISFLFGIYGKQFAGIDTYILAVIVSILAAFVLSGAPGGGLVGEMLIVSLFNFPPESFPIIATIGFLVDPAATCLNSSGDTIASMMVTKMVEGADWIRNSLKA